MFVLTYPWALVLLCLPLLIWFTMPPMTAQVRSALMIPFFQDMFPLIAQQKNITLKRGGFLGLYLAWIFLIIALAGPTWVGPPRLLARDGYNIMLALDISPSMSINDMVDHGHRITRLVAVKRAAKQFVDRRVGDKLGLILFGEQAYVFTPLTYDRKTLASRIDDASVGLAGKTTSIGDALGLAIKRLQQVPAQGRMIVLLTDGVSNSGVLPPLKAAELAKSEGIQINTIGLHANLHPQSFDGLFLSLSGAADLDEPTLKSVAKLTGGHYFRATDQASLERIYHFIDKMARVSQEQTTLRPEYPYYPWFLAIGLGLLLCSLGRRYRHLFAFGGHSHD